MYKEQILVIHAKSYEVYDETTRETNRGLTLRYVNKGKLFPISSTKNGNYQGGYALAKASLPVDFISKLVNVPAVYEAGFDIVVKSDGKTELKMQELNFLRDIDMTDVSEQKK